MGIRQHTLDKPQTELQYTIDTGSDINNNDNLLLSHYINDYFGQWRCHIIRITAADGGRAQKV